MAPTGICILANKTRTLVWHDWYLHSGEQNPYDQSSQQIRDLAENLTRLWLKELSFLVCCDSDPSAKGSTGSTASELAGFWGKRGPALPLGKR